MFDLSGKVAIVTGATKGLGYGMALGLAEAGANVVVVSRHQDECEKVAEEIKEMGVDAFPMSCDVTRKESIDDLICAVVEKYGKIDVLVNNAGVAVTVPAENITEEEWDKVVNTNLRGVFFMAQAVGRQMIKQQGGSIINIASMFGLVGDKSILPYLASKGGVIQITKGLALEWAKYNIRVNSVAPGYVKTAINEKELETEAIKKKLISKTPMRRYGTKEEIASAVVYLASDEASYVTGAVLSVDGGWVAQ